MDSAALQDAAIVSADEAVEWKWAQNGRQPSENVRGSG